MPRNNILLRTLPMPKKVKLVNGPIFFAKYQRVGWAALLERVRARRTYQRKIGPRNKRKPRRRRNAQVGSGMATDNLVSTAFSFGKKQQHQTLEKRW